LHTTESSDSGAVPISDTFPHLFPTSSTPIGAATAIAPPSSHQFLLSSSPPMSASSSPRRLHKSLLTNATTVRQQQTSTFSPLSPRIQHRDCTIGGGIAIPTERDYPLLRLNRFYKKSNGSLYFVIFYRFGAAADAAIDVDLTSSKRKVIRQLF